MLSVRVVVGTILATVVAIAGAQTLDFSERMTPVCELAGMVAAPPSVQWFNVPFEDPPEGHLGCQMMRTDADEVLVGIIRVRSAVGLDPEALLGNELTALGLMGYEPDELLWRKDDVPVRAPGTATSGRAVGFSARVEGNPVPQEIHLLVFELEGARYLFTLATPHEGYDGELYRTNLRDFARVLQSLDLP